MTINPNDLDRWITGNYGEDFLGDERFEHEDGCGLDDDHIERGDPCYTLEDHLADEADRKYDEMKDRRCAD